MSRKMNSQVQFLLERPNPALGRIIPFETQEYHGGPLMQGPTSQGGSLLGRTTRSVGRFVKKKVKQNLEMPVKAWQYQINAINKATDRLFPLHEQLTQVGGRIRGKRSCSC